MKKGAPTRAVMMPTSSSEGRATMRPMTSEATSSEAPASAENGSSQRWSTPTRSRQRWGTTSPTNQIGPATAVAAALGVALLIYGLAFKGGVAGTRLILIGIGVGAMLTSVINYVLTKAGQWDYQEALRWLTGSLNGTTWTAVLPAVVALLVLAPVLLGQSKNLSALQLGEETAAALGVRVERTRLIAIVAAVGLVAFATAACGPIAFVSFLAGPIAARIVGPHGSLLVPAALVGALLVLVADLAGQFAFDTRFPVGVVTGVLGAPYLIYLIIRTNRAGGSL